MQALRQAIRDALGLTHPAASPERHLQATMAWLCRAQDVGPDDGVARMYHLKTGWGASYPETTGYIIPTFLDYACYTGDAAYTERALRMADWEIAVQMPTGAVQGGTVADPPTPAVFNTGQVIFGWHAAHRESGEGRYLEALVRAADWLCATQDGDGAWRRDLSAFCDAPVDTYAYNVRTGWALLLADRVAGNGRYRDAGARKLAFTLALTRPNGWTAKNCLSDPTQPLLHTIAYTLQGMLESAVILEDEAALARVTEACRHLLETQGPDGSLRGRYDSEWHPTVRWRCLTGEAQTAIVWFRLAAVSGDASWVGPARRLNDALRRTQALAGNPDTVGGVRGARPVWGPYGPYEHLNWAAKFFADALLLELGFAEAGRAG
jgi:hypothetical protein